MFVKRCNYLPIYINLATMFDIFHFKAFLEKELTPRAGVVAVVVVVVV